MNFFCDKLKNNVNPALISFIISIFFLNITFVERLTYHYLIFSFSKSQRALTHGVSSAGFIATIYHNQVNDSLVCGRFYNDTRDSQHSFSALIFRLFCSLTFIIFSIYNACHTFAYIYIMSCHSLLLQRLFSFFTAPHYFISGDWILEKWKNKTLLLLPCTLKMWIRLNWHLQTWLLLSPCALL